MTRGLSRRDFAGLLYAGPAVWPVVALARADEVIE
jgi:hypothetical protein